jgi:hypothetical protein
MRRRCLPLLLAAALVASCAAPKPKPPKGPVKPPAPREEEAPKPPKPPGKPRLSPTEEVVAKLGDKVTSRLGRPFARAGVRPPKRVHLLAFKQERLLELWADDGGGPRFIRSYPILAASGKAGPKLVEGDLQVPEGVYRVSWLNPKSAYHLSLKLDYPNEFDRARAAEESRVNLGGDIFVHGRDASIGCLAMGDPAIEDLFVVTAQIGAENVRVVIAPNDLRSKSPPTDLRYSPAWLPELYQDLRRQLEPFALR